MGVNKDAVADDAACQGYYACIAELSPCDANNTLGSDRVNPT